MISGVFNPTAWKKIRNDKARIRTFVGVLGFTNDPALAIPGPASSIAEPFEAGLLPARSLHFVIAESLGFVVYEVS